VGVKMYSTLTLGEKIKQIRTAKGLTQLSMAHAIKSSEAVISRIERGQAECSSEMLVSIKKFLGIENAPLSEDELEEYKNQIWVVDSLVKDFRVSDSKAMLENMYPIHKLPFESNLNMLCVMLEIKILIWEANVKSAAEKINAVDAKVESACIEVQNLYHRNKAAICMMMSDYKNGLKHGLKILALECDDVKTDASVYNAIGSAYFLLGQPHLAIIYLERAMMLYQGSPTNIKGIAIAYTIGRCYSLMRRENEAETIYMTTLVQAKSIKNRQYIVMLTNSLAITYINTNRAGEAMYLINEIIVHEESDEYKNWLHVEGGVSNSNGCLVTKASCLLHLKKYAECEKWMKQISDKIESDNTAIMMLEAIAHRVKLATQKSSESADYIEKTLIPHYRNQGFLKVYALELCEELEAHYTKARKTKKAIDIALVTRDIYKEILFGDGE